MKRVAVRRRRTGKPRRGPLRDVKYRMWVARHWCCVCYPHMGASQYLLAAFMSQAAHTQNNGMSSKGPDFSCVPLCQAHHKEYDAGRAAFEKKYDANMKVIAARYWTEYNREMGRA